MFYFEEYYKLDKQSLKLFNNQCSDSRFIPKHSAAVKNKKRRAQQKKRKGKVK